MIEKPMRKIPAPSNGWVKTFKDKPQLCLPTKETRESRRGQLRMEIKQLRKEHDDAVLAMRNGASPENPEFLKELQTKILDLEKQFDELGPKVK
jgi:hypothetical protein